MLQTTMLRWVLLAATAKALELVGTPPRVRNVTNECYVFAEIWTPEFCQTGTSAGATGGAYPGCQRPLPYWEYNFTIHGLWPQYTDTDGYPQVGKREGSAGAAELPAR